MTKRSRVAAFLSVSALCLGLTAAPAVFAADAGSTTAKPTTKAHTHKHKAKSGSTAKKSATPATPAQ
jgi:hypothetical protein